MSLAVGKGPFGPRRSGEFNFDTNVLKPHTLYFEPTPKRVRAFFGGEVVADSRRAKLLHETAIMPVYYFPEEDVRFDLLTPTDHTTHCPFKGDASYWTVRAGGEVGENLVWSYREPGADAGYLKGHVAFYFERMERWMEEEEEILGHPRDPYHRVDVIRGSGPVTVSVNGETVAETEAPMVLFETGLPPRYYVPPGDVRRELLQASETRTVCPYKGVASYWSVRLGGATVEDAAWSYPDPLSEAARVEDHLCFSESVAGVEVSLPQ
ncbi:protein of unknown function (DUF427) [Rubrobacter radiotolerans]|uniref:DUF427 domain-containing protein n=1 Tax=Rubrobacter radiotolerans TaxID=42256 RepID=A0A023X084_RUBRA|nr:DUF427 domain-containing protein [Rubrobacter radiotolerans]AHY45430.1 protein of unknown function (DUF427) [Rubrobacter radiotolerans]MDX5892841.1 DUF427 domain-containing protein [Rubrobacter radiotolerans]SMC02602.1 Uncharacterized conserved protein, DUF427 family [Rubrobacter radiotolerans DSM 5868]